MKRSDVKIGMKVRVSNNPKDPEKPPGWDMRMDHLKGVTLTIQGKYGNFFSVEENPLAWAARWFTEVK